MTSPARALPTLLIVTDDPGQGGTAEVARRLSIGMQQDFRVFLACKLGSSNAAWRGLLEAAAVSLLDFDVEHANLWRSTYNRREPARLIAQLKPDLILFCDAAMVGSMLAAKGVAAAARIPYISVINGLSPDFASRLAPFAQQCRRGLEQAAALVFVSQATKQQFEAIFPDLATTRAVIPNGRPQSYFRPPDRLLREELRRRLKIHEDDLLCLSAGRLEPEKGQGRIITAFGRLAAEGRADGIRLAFAGSGREEHLEALRAQSARLGLACRVDFLGQRDDLPELLDAADAFLLASESEGMPLSVIEAMAKGLPVAASAVGGIPEQLGEDAGILLPPPTENEGGALEALARALLLLAADPQVRRELGQRARARAERLFGEAAMMSHYRALLREIATRPRRELKELPQEHWTIGGVTTLDYREPERIWNYLGDGWSANEPHGIWSVGRESFVTLPLRQEGCDSLRLIFEVTPLVTPVHPCQETEIFINGRRVARLMLTESLRQRISVPVKLFPGERLLELRLLHHRAVAPSRLDRSVDTRLLALCLHSLTVRPPRFWPLGHRISGGGFPEESLVWGWSFAESWGRWSDGARARLSFALPARPTGDLELIMDLRSYSARWGQRQRVRFMVAGQLCKEVRLAQRRRPRPVRLRIPRALLSQELLLDIELPDAAVPAQLGASEDTRALGIALHAITLRAAAPLPRGLVARRSRAAWLART